MLEFINNDNIFMKGKRTIGLFGAIGYDDIGDDAILLANIDALRNKNYKLIIFSRNQKKTNILLEKEGFINNDHNFNQIQVVESLDVYLSRKSNIFRYIDFIIDEIFDKLFRVRLGLFNSFYFLTLSYRLKNIYRNRKNKKEKFLFADFISNIENCSVIFFIGGGYFNKHLGHKINQFLLALDIANYLSKPIIASGQTFGPLNIIQKKLFKKRIKWFKYFGVRDIKKSSNNLLELGFPIKNIIEGSDDAIFLDKRLVRYIDDSNFQVIVNLGGFIKYSKNLSYFYQSLGKFLDELIKTKNAKVFYILMHSTGSSDYLRGKKIQKYMEFYKQMIFMPVLSAKEIKYIISKSNFVISNRLHPIVFAISEKVPFIGISAGGEYYNLKLKGVSECYGYVPEKYIIDINKVTPKKLIKMFGFCINHFFPDENIYRKNKRKRIYFLNILYGLTK